MPNFITLSRIILSLALLPIHTFSQLFFVIYTYCGVSDVLDGALARKFSLTSEKGARLDSIADIVFYGVTAFKIIPSLCNTLTTLIWCIIAVAALIRIISYVVAAIKYRRFASLHTYMNKLTGFLIFTVPYILSQPFAVTACMVISVVAVLAALEEFVIHISTTQYCADRKTLRERRKITMKKSICGADCNNCGYGKNNGCKGCADSKGCPFGKECFIAKYISMGGVDSYNLFKKNLTDEFNALNIPGMPKIDDLFPLNGAFVNLAYPMPNGKLVKLLNDNEIYLGNQVECEFNDGELTKCYGLVAGMDFLLVCEYGKNCTDPEIVIYKKR